jgi:hypothetical protein
MKNMRVYPVFSMLAALAISISSQAATEAETSPQQLYADQLYARGDYPTAMKLYLSMAKDGDNFAQYRVSFMYLEGQGLEPEMVESYAWAAVAAQSGQMELLRYRDTVGSLIPKKQQRKAVRRAEFYLRKWGSDEIADEYREAARKELRKCTGSRVGSRCEDVESADMPTFWAITPGDGSNPGSGGDGGGSAPSGSVQSPQGPKGTGGGRNVEYYQELRASLRQLNTSIGQTVGHVEVHEIETLEESPPPPEAAQEVPDRN